jgi:hypothetical protein
MRPVIAIPAWLRKWREAKSRPVPGNSPHDRLLRGPDVPSLKESLRRFLSRHSVTVASNHTGAPGNAFFRHCGIYPSDVGFWSNPSLDWSRCLPPTAPDPSPRTRREDHALPIVQMSSGRLRLRTCRIPRSGCSPAEPVSASPATRS